jgi:hypothetical protein
MILRGAGPRVSGKRFRERWVDSSWPGRDEDGLRPNRNSNASADMASLSS